MALERNKSGISRMRSSMNQGSYDVFLSFRGEDTRNNFTGFFYRILALQGIHAFFDEKDLAKGKKIEEILEDIGKCKILVPIFSPRYAESTWCLREVTKMVECDGGGQERLIIPIFFNVDPKDVRRQTGPFEAAFKEHLQKEKTEDVDGWRRALGYVGGISGYDLEGYYKGNQWQLVDSIIEEIRKVLATKRPLHEEEYLVGVDVRVDEIINRLDFEADGVRIIGIHGIGGVGKTTLAKAIYNRSRHLFQASFFIENVREVAKLSKGGQVQVQQQLVQDIEDRVRGKRVLLVLDDVGDKKQLDALAGVMKGFGSRSRVIVTTRQKKILEGLKVEAVYYSLEQLEEKEALQLFNHHAFGDDGPQEEYNDLIQEVVSISNRLPLALQVFGALFKTAGTLKEWKDLLKDLKRHQHKDIHEKLKICYDSLEKKEKQIFLDIACLLVGKNSEDAIYVWEELDLSPHITLRSLQDRSLIKINKGRFEMHDQIRDMGREVVLRESPHHPESRSRLWDTGDVMKASTKSQGNMTEGIILDVHEGSETKLSTHAFELLSELRILHINFAIFAGRDFKHFPASLKWLEWKGCPLKALPLESKFKRIVVLSLSGSSISQLWSEKTWLGSKAVKESFVGLKVLDLSSCRRLIATPNFAMAPNLEKLTLDVCISLREIHDSIGYLKKLVFLSMRECVSLKKLPNKIYELSSLQVFNLEGCRALVALPEILEDSNPIIQLDPDGTSTSRILFINQTPHIDVANSTIDLSKQEGLILRDCVSLKFLPYHPRMFPSLRCLHIDGCLQDMAFRVWDIEAVYISGSPTLPQKQEYSFVLPVGSISDPLLLQQLRCHSHGDPCLNGTMVLTVHRKELTDERWIALDTYEARSEDSNYKDDVYGHCYTINFGSNDKINEVPRGKTTIMKVTTSNTCKLTKVDVKLQNRRKFSGENMKPFISTSRREASTGPPPSLPLSSSRRSELQVSIFFNHSEEEVKPDVIEYSTAINNCIEQIMKQLNVQCDESMLLFGWTIKELIIFTLIFRDINVLWYELGHGTGLPRPASLEVFDKIKILDLSYCELLDKTHDFAWSPNLEKLVLDHCEHLLEIDESIGQLENLILLSIVGCTKLGALPYGILRLKSLQVLNIEKCPKIKMLPEESMMDVRLEVLEELTLDGCTSLTEFPDCDGGFRSLRNLSLRNCRLLKQLPVSIGRLEALENLILDGCTSLIGLSNHVERCWSLRLLSMKDCSSLIKLPDSIGSLEVLEELILDGCTSLTEFPDCDGGFRSLRHLSLRSCRLLDQLPDSIGSSKVLEELILDGCSSLKGLPNHDELDMCVDLPSGEDISSLEKLSDSTGSLGDLEVVGCSQEVISDGCTSLTKRPDYVAQFRSLRRLSLECAQLVYLRQPISFGSLENLQELALGMSLSTVIPDHIGLLKSLRSLSLRGCRSVEQLSDTIGSLVVLEELLFDCFPLLETLPDSIGNLKSLTKIRCINCHRLTSMPDLSGLTALEELDVAGCGSLLFIPGLEKLISLKVLHICGCRCLDLERIRLQLQVAEFHDLEAFSISAFRCSHYVGIPFPIGRRTSSRPLLVERIDVLGRINIYQQPSHGHVRCEIKAAVAEDGVPYYVDAYLTGRDLSYWELLLWMQRKDERVRRTKKYCVYSASIGEYDEINQRLRVLAAARTDHASRVGTINVSCSERNFCAASFDVHMVSPNSRSRTQGLRVNYISMDGNLINHGRGKQQDKADSYDLDCNNSGRGNQQDKAEINQLVQGNPSTNLGNKLLRESRKESAESQSVQTSPINFTHLR